MISIGPGKSGSAPQRPWTQLHIIRWGPLKLLCLQVMLNIEQSNSFISILDLQQPRESDTTTKHCKQTAKNSSQECLSRDHFLGCMYTYNIEVLNQNSRLETLSRVGSSTWAGLTLTSALHLTDFRPQRWQPAQKLSNSLSLSHGLSTRAFTCT